MQGDEVQRRAFRQGRVEGSFLGGARQRLEFGRSEHTVRARMQERAFGEYSREQETEQETGKRGAVRSVRLQVLEEKHPVLAQTATQDRGRRRGVLVQRVHVQNQQEIFAVLAHKAETQGGKVLRV